MANPKIRADQLMVEQGLLPSREAAERLIMSGRAYLLEKGAKTPLDKPGRMLARTAVIGMAQAERFVSRGGYKLLGAIEHFGLEVTGLVALDVGASTGGFTDCLLQHGAARVYAVDVGKSQLHEKLVADPRVVSIEGLNFRLAQPDLLPEAVDMAVIDVSFISLTRVLGPVRAFLRPGARVVALVKPQFELGSARTVKGVVRAVEDQLEAVALVQEYARGIGFTNLGVTPASVKGPKGNQEYLALMQKTDAPA